MERRVPTLVGLKEKSDRSSLFPWGEIGEWEEGRAREKFRRGKVCV